MRSTPRATTSSPGRCGLRSLPVRCAVLVLAVMGAASVPASLAPAAAHADDLLVQNGDTETLSGSQQYGVVYIDGTLQLTDDTTISATSSIYIGPDASIVSCYVPGVGDGGCTAGRSLTLNAAGALTVATGIDLTAGSGNSRPAGNLTLSGSPVTVAGDINTAGSDGAASGSVSITSGGAIAVEGINAPGAPVGLTASGQIVVAGDVSTSGDDSINLVDPTRAASAGAVTIDSSGGDARLEGAIYADGLDAPGSGTLGGGNGAAVSITAGNVLTGEIDATGGESNGSLPGDSAPITISARGSLQALGQLDVSGQNGASGEGTAGAKVSLAAAGALTVGGDVLAGGGQGAAGGTIALGGSTVTCDELIATGGDGAAASPAHPGGAGGSITVTAPGGASLGAVEAYGGGSGGGGKPPGAGGSVSVTSSGGSIATATVQTEGGWNGDGPGANAGPVSLLADDNLDVGGTLNASGSNANGTAYPPTGGGNAANVELNADTGTLSLEGNAMARGGAGGSVEDGYPLGGTGGSGGRIEIVAHTLGAIASLSSSGGDGGDYGDNQGPGGPGGSILAFTAAPLFDAHQLVDSYGGDGNPTGVQGSDSQDEAPTSLTIDPSTGVLGFTSQSPDAQSYSVLESVAGATATTVLQSTSTSGLRPPAPLCVPVTLAVVAVNASVAWTSDPSNAVTYERPPSAQQSCADAPQITLPGSLRRTVPQLRRAHWVASVLVATSGIGALQVTLQSLSSPSANTPTKPGKQTPGRKHHPKRDGPIIATLSTQLTHPGATRLRIVIPAADRTPGRYALTLTSTSPDGKGRATARCTMAIVK